MQDGADGEEDEVQARVGGRGETFLDSDHAGDAEDPRALHDYIQARGAFRFAFEFVKPRRLVEKRTDSDRVVEGHNKRSLSAGEAAASVARLIVAALMAKKEPQRLRVNLRKGGPEHILLTKFARRVEDSYRRQEITHFHDGFAVLTRAHTNMDDQPPAFQ